MRRVRPRSGKQPDPARRERISGGIPRRTTGRTSGAIPTRGTSPRDSQPITRTGDRMPRQVPGPTRQSGPMPVRRGSTPVRRSGPVDPPRRTTGRNSGPIPRRDARATSEQGGGAIPQRNSEPLAERDGLPRTTQPGEDSRLAPELVSASRRPTSKEPPWFPQVPMRPGEAVEEQESGHSWWWILLIMAMAGAAAWWMQTR